MLSLRSLRLNCWLAGCVPGVVAAVLLLILGDRIGAAHRQVYAEGLLTTLQAHAQHSAAPAAVYTDAAPWSGVARVLVDAEGGLRPRDMQGQLRMDMLNPDPELFDAVTQPQVWEVAGGQMRAAVALEAEDGTFEALLYAEARRSLEVGRNWIALVATLVLALSAAMGWYLVRRVYRPVEDLSAQAEAALRGRMLPQRYRSHETEATASAVHALASAYVSHQQPALAPQDGKSAPQSSQPSPAQIPAASPDAADGAQASSPQPEAPAEDPKPCGGR